MQWFMTINAVTARQVQLKYRYGVFHATVRIRGEQHTNLQDPRNFQMRESLEFSNAMFFIHFSHSLIVRVHNNQWDARILITCILFDT